jgi:hypothetical protein
LHHYGPVLPTPAHYLQCWMPWWCSSWQCFVINVSEVFNLKTKCYVVKVFYKGKHNFMSNTRNLFKNNVQTPPPSIITIRTGRNSFERERFISQRKRETESLETSEKSSDHTFCNWRACDHSVQNIWSCDHSLRNGRGTIKRVTATMQAVIIFTPMSIFDRIEIKPLKSSPTHCHLF